MVDRGAHQSLVFEKCAKGFLLRTKDSGFATIYAFNTAAEVAEWIAREYGPPPSPYQNVPLEEMYRRATGEPA